MVELRVVLACLLVVLLRLRVGRSEEFLFEVAVGSVVFVLSRE
jgi:hypothetical protein